jgi:hypothetical protein
MVTDERRYNTPTGLTGSIKQQLRARIPFSISALADRDDLGWLSLVADQGHRRLYKFQDGNLLWATIVDNTIVAIEFIEGRAAKKLWHELGTRLPPDRRRQILAALRPGRAVGEALREAFGAKLQSLTDVAERKKAFTRKNSSTPTMKMEYVFEVHHYHPVRRAILHLEVDAQNSILSTRLLSGQAAAELLKATQSWQKNQAREDRDT